MFTYKSWVSLEKYIYGFPANFKFSYSDIYMIVESLHSSFILNIHAHVLVRILLLSKPTTRC